MSLKLITNQGNIGRVWHCNSNDINLDSVHIMSHPAHEIAFVITFSILKVNTLSKG